MKNQREIYEALLRGETLLNKDGDLVKLKDGNLYNVKQECRDDWGFVYENSWQIYKEPKWYENMPVGGVLCWVDIDKNYPVAITGYMAGMAMPYSEKQRNWSVCHAQATPLTKQEIQIFMENVPDER